MGLTNKLRKLLHRKAWEMCTPAPVNTAAGSFVEADRFNLIPDALAFYVQGASAIYRYDGNEDSWIQLPNSGIAGTFGAGACGEFRALSAMGGVFTQTATAGTTTTITTNRTIVRNLAGVSIRVIAGAGVGYLGQIESNTIGTNAVLTVAVPSGVAFNATTQFQVFGGSLWVQGASAGAGFSVYDLATNTWTARTAVGVTWGTDGCLVGTPDFNGVGAFASGTASSGTTTTLTTTGTAWLTNQWANYQIRLTGGTGIGQIRTISSNTGTAVTVSSAWTITPDATTSFAIEANHDFFYLLGNSAVTLYRYSVSANTWTTLTPAAARATPPGAGCTGLWVNNVPEWTTETAAPSQWTASGTAMFRQNGRYIYSFRGGASNALDIYDIAGNTWISNVPYANQFETFTTGSCATISAGRIYLQKEATGRLFAFNIHRHTMMSLSTNVALQGAAVAGNKLFILPYTDRDTVTFLYMMPNTRNELFRMVLI